MLGSSPSATTTPRPEGDAMFLLLPKKTLHLGFSLCSNKELDFPCPFSPFISLSLSLLPFASGCGLPKGFRLKRNFSLFTFFCCCLKTVFERVVKLSILFSSQMCLKKSDSIVSKIFAGKNKNKKAKKWKTKKRKKKVVIHRETVRLFFCLLFYQPPLL